MAYENKDIGYWQKQYYEQTEYSNTLRAKIVMLEERLHSASEKIGLLEEISRPVMFVEDGSVDVLPDYIRLLYTVIIYRQGFNQPQIFDTRLPFNMAK